MRKFREVRVEDVPNVDRNKTTDPINPVVAKFERLEIVTYSVHPEWMPAMATVTTQT